MRIRVEYGDDGSFFLLFGGHTHCLHNCYRNGILLFPPPNRIALSAYLHFLEKASPNDWTAGNLSFRLLVPGDLVLHTAHHKRHVLALADC